jgi:hypothetical protein
MYPLLTFQKMTLVKIKRCNYFYVVNQNFEYYLTKFNYIFIFKLFYYFCYQEVEDEAGSAGEQPVSNKLPVLRCNKFEETVFVLSLFYLLQITPYG